MASPVLRPDPFQLGGAVLDGRFNVTGEVAEGGFGVVYYAIQVALDRPVALKVLKTPPGMDQAARGHFHEKFAAEARTIARIRHPNIVDVYDFGVSQMPSGELAPWMALEWINGRTLDDYLTSRRGGGGQSPAEVLALLRPVLRAFAYTHRDGIAHRDIKPANLMMVAGDGGHHAAEPESGTLLRVLDFGIAKVMNGGEDPGSGHTRTSGMPAFSPQYAAPEQVAFGRTGPWTDVHALGLILTEMLVDQIPYQAKDVQLYEEVMSTRRPTPASKGRDVGPWERIIGRALALSPTERWKSAAELLTALEETVDAATAAATAGAIGRAGSTVALPGTTDEAALARSRRAGARAAASVEADVNAAENDSAEKRASRSRWLLIAGGAAALAVAAVVAVAVATKDRAPRDQGPDPASVELRPGPARADNTAPSPVIAPAPPPTTAAAAPVPDSRTTEAARPAATAPAPSVRANVARKGVKAAGAPSPQPGSRAQTPRSTERATERLPIE